MSASALVAMLAARHADDVFVPECKDGPTQTRAHLRLDAWVLAKTWSPITTIGYEVKVDRGDWRRDDKIHNYMPLCHLLYVVAPKGIVPADELPAGVGLMEPVGTGGRLQIKRKAARREIALPAELMVYVLMCRTKITRETGPLEDRGWRVRQLEDWVKSKGERRELSYAVSQRIRDAFDAQESKIREQERRHEELEAVRQRVAELGFDINQPVSRWNVRRKLDALNVTVSSWTLQQMRDAAKLIERTANELEELKVGRADGESAA